MTNLIDHKFENTTHVTSEFLRDLADYIDANNPDRRIEVAKLIHPTSFEPYIGIPMRFTNP